MRQANDVGEIWQILSLGAIVRTGLTGGVYVEYCGMVILGIVFAVIVFGFIFTVVDGIVEDGKVICEFCSFSISQITPSESMSNAMFVL